MTRKDLKRFSGTIALVLAVAMLVPVAWTVVILIRAAGLLFIAGALGGVGVAMSIHPSFRKSILRRLGSGTKEDLTPQPGGMP